MDSLSTTDDHVMIYMTAPSHQEAEKIAQALVGERLAACVNILGPAMSIYRWEGKVEQAQEIVLIAKTRRGRADALAARVKTLHSYEIPCIVQYRVEAATKDFLAWVDAETKLN